MGEYTKGPWTLDHDCKTAVQAGDKHIAMVNYYNSHEARTRVSGAEHEANARLIAAAPDLLAVVAETCAIFDLNHEEGYEYNGDLVSDLWKAGIHEKLTAAIAKAILPPPPHQKDNTNDQ